MRRKRFPCYRCTRISHHEFSACSIKSLNTNKIEKAITEYMFRLSSNQTNLECVGNDLNCNLKRSIEPMQKEQKELSRRMNEIETGISRLIDAIGSGELPVKRVKDAIAEREEQLKELQSQLVSVQQKMNESSVAECHADVLKEKLKDFKMVFSHVTGKEKSEALQCMIQDIEVLRINSFLISMNYRTLTKVRQKVQFGGASEDRTRDLLTASQALIPAEL